MGEVELRSAPGDELPCVRVCDDVAVVIHDEDRSAAYARFLQPAENAIERYDCCQHPAEFFVYLERDGHEESRAVVGAERQRVAAEDDRLRARRKPPLQGPAHKRVLIRAEVARACPLAGLTHCGEIKDVGITGDEILEQPGDLWRSHRIVDPAGRREPGFVAR